MPEPMIQKFHCCSRNINPCHPHENLTESEYNEKMQEWKMEVKNEQ